MPETSVSEAEVQWIQELGRFYLISFFLLIFNLLNYYFSNCRDTLPGKFTLGSQKPWFPWLVFLR